MASTEGCEGECRTPFGRGDRCQHCREASGPLGLRRCRRLVAASRAMQEVLARAEAFARADGPVILLGETGTGKEVLARALHGAGRRAGQPFVAVNCGAIPAELVESELFGHARGAFTGAVSERRGLIVEANGGTLLLDEVAELPPPAQVKLLRVLQEREVRPVGSDRVQVVDVRVLAATHRDLGEEVARGRFRADLYYRLKTFALTLPPLRHRPEDVLPLAVHFLGQEERALRLSEAAERALRAWGWPGNVRELMSAMRFAVALAPGEVVEPEHLPDELRTGAAPGVTSTLRPLAAVERDHVLAVLAACGGNHAEAARVLGIGRNTLWRKLARYGAAPPPGR
jgi:two-component system response regulator HydG